MRLLTPANSAHLRPLRIWWCTTVEATHQQPAIAHAAAAMSSTPTNVVSKRARGGGRSPGSPWQLAICKLMILSYLPDRSKAPRSNLRKVAQRTLARSLPVRQTSPHTHAAALSGLWPLPRLRAVKLWSGGAELWCSNLQTKLLRRGGGVLHLSRRPSDRSSGWAHPNSPLTR